jgi:uncharacterized protein Yka (UPF0111/DUF47 family)
MFSLQKFFSKDDQFFDLLEASALQAHRSVEILNQILSAPAQVPDLGGFHEAKQAGKKINDQIGESLVKTFVTYLDREDIELLSSVLYKIPKTVEKFAERFIISGPLVRTVNFARHIHLLQAATNQVVAMVKQIRMGISVEGIKEMNRAIQKIEGEADDLILETLKDLYSGRHDATTVVAMKDLYELLEKVIDRCRDAGNMVTHIILKHA